MAQSCRLQPVSVLAQVSRRSCLICKNLLTKTATCRIQKHEMPEDSKVEAQARAGGQLNAAGLGRAA